LRLLLDTHTLLWWLSEDSALPQAMRRLIGRSGDVIVSAASAWEIGTKFRLGRLPTAAELVGDFEGYLVRERFQSLPISAAHGVRAGLLPGPHRDPFDRMLAAQAQLEGFSIVSNDEVFDNFGVRRVWQ
jgi:PIN domain nuclease of toxin-antitoxin system